MGDLICVDFITKRKEMKFEDPRSRKEIKELDLAIKVMLQKMVKCTNDQAYMRMVVVQMQDLLDKCLRDIE